MSSSKQVNVRPTSTEMAESGPCEAENRANVYEFLSRIFLEEMDSGLLQALQSDEVAGIFLDWGINFQEDLAGENQNEILEQLAHAYCDTFVTGEDPVFSPYESVWKTGCLEGKSTLLVEEFYTKCSLGLPKNCPEFADHLGIEFDLMSRLAKKEAEFRLAAQTAQAENYHKFQQAFLKNHLLAWGPEFSAKIERWASHPFYQHIGKLSCEFLRMEAEEFELESEPYMEFSEN
ncbi:MAG: molecular chaperone TorD family protein [SAR324 cluster bacterium]|nr:molecular chaperone TorD family protein [SAR324 cluster bacterium]MBL7034309.1 molecular chaperone TorD family protein [SAR324 cluster bacterium]